MSNSTKVSECSETKATGTITIPFFSLEYLMIISSVMCPNKYIKCPCLSL